MSSVDGGWGRDGDAASLRDSLERTGPSFPETVREEFEEALKLLVEIPTVSNDPVHQEDVRRGAECAAEMLHRFGAAAEIAPTPGNPIVLGEFRVSGRVPTLTIYNHLDVQPAAPEEWTHPPFSFVKDGDKYLGRGTTDDKGPALTALFAARQAHRMGVPLNIRLLWEMEEEIGSPHFDDFLRRRKESLHTDSVLVSDSIWVAKDRPAVNYALRGLLGVVFRLRTGTKDVHSGLAGGAARNPLSELVDLLNRCFDGKTGKVKIPGFYESVRKPSAAEIKSFLASGFSVSKFTAAHGLKGVRHKDTATLLKSIWAMPTFEVHGFSGGYSGPGIKTVVPPVAEAKVSMRLVPDQDPKKIFKLVKDFAHEVNPSVEVVPHGFLEPYLGPSTGPYAEAASTAILDAFGRKPAFVREGGSIGAVLSMHRVFKAPVLLMGLSLPEHSYHGPNEYFDWGQASGGMKAFVRYFEQIAEL
jgi:acetylornithine deacetylase/succinyl-diaminopimelate desuccinylase-like protein